MERLNENALLELYKVPVLEWDKLYCELNSWKIPEQLKKIKPDWWDDDSSREKSDKMIEFIRPLIFKIKSTIGKKACSREWNKDTMTDKEHEIFWAKWEEQK